MQPASRVPSSLEPFSALSISFQSVPPQTQLSARPRNRIAGHEPRQMSTTARAGAAVGKVGRSRGVSGTPYTSHAPSPNVKFKLPTTPQKRPRKFTARQLGRTQLRPRL